MPATLFLRLFYNNCRLIYCHSDSTLSAFALETNCLFIRSYGISSLEATLTANQPTRRPSHDRPADSAEMFGGNASAPKERGMRASKREI